MGVLGHFLYRPDFGAKGQAEYSAFDGGLVAADAEIYAAQLHGLATTGVHGVGVSTVESVAGSQAKVDTHKDLTTGVHGVGAGTVAKTSDITATKLDDFAAPDDNVDLNASITKHGLCPKGTNIGNFLKDDLTWASPAAATDHGSLTGLADDDHTQYILADGTRAIVELTLTPKLSSSGPEGTIFYCSTDNAVYVGVE